MIAYYVAFREENADEIRALSIKKNCQIFKEACQQMERMLLQVVNAPAVALEILSGLTRTQIVLLSCATIVAGQCFLNVTGRVDSRDWTDKERAVFANKFTSYVDGPQDQERILHDWEELVKVSQLGQSDTYAELICTCPSSFSTRYGRGDQGGPLLRRGIRLYRQELRSSRSWIGFHERLRY